MQGRGADLGQGAATLALLEPPERRRGAPTVLRWIAAIAGAAVVNALLIRWLG